MSREKAATKAEDIYRRKAKLEKYLGQFENLRAEIVEDQRLTSDEKDVLCDRNRFVAWDILSDIQAKKKRARFTPEVKRVGSFIKKAKKMSVTRAKSDDKNAEQGKGI